MAHKIVRIISSLTLTLQAFTGLALVAPSVYAQSDSTIIQMQEAYRAKRQAVLTSLLPSAQGHILEPWAAYWELSNRLESASESEVLAFFQKYAGTYQEDRLRNDWLLLMGKRGDWASFNRVIEGFRMQDDRAVRCYSAVAKGSPASLADTVMQEWAALRGQSEACSLAAAAYFRSGRVSANQIWRIARLAAEANLRTGIEQAVRIVSPAKAQDVFRLVSNPHLFLQGGQSYGQQGLSTGNFASASELADYLAAQMRAQAAAPTPTPNTALWAQGEDQEMAALALIRIAASSASEAARLMQNEFDAVLQGPTRSWVWGVIGKQSALDLSPLASGYFEKALNADLNDDLLGWKVRAALRSARWRDVEPAIAAMSGEAQAESIWMYWRARALAASNDAKAARALYQKMVQGQSTYAGRSAGIEDFYVQLATEELGKKIVLPPSPRSISEDERQAALRNPGLQRALYAISMGLRSEGNREWNYQTNLHKPGGKSDRERLAAAALACEREVWDRCINTSERTKTEFDAQQRYPMPHQNDVVYHSSTVGLDPAYVYGLIRQESRFMSTARSGAGASGLMQVMRDTARLVARRIGLSNYVDSMINNKEVNLQLGTHYLKMALDDFEGSKPMALAAYNAGPSRPRRWREAATTPSYLEPAIWVETIPFGETRDYVKKVLSNNVMYAALLTGNGQSLKERLGQAIGPRASTSPPSDLSLP